MLQTNYIVLKFGYDVNTMLIEFGALKATAVMYRFGWQTFVMKCVYNISS